MGAMYESLNGESSVLAVTGQTPMFWFELLILQFAGASVFMWSLHSDMLSLLSLFLLQTHVAAALLPGVRQALWYLDVVLDVKQLSLFWHTHMYDYMVCNLLGLVSCLVDWGAFDAFMLCLTR